VLIAIIFATLSRSRFRRRLVKLTLRLLAGCVVALLVYGFMVGMQTYDRRYPDNGHVASEKIIGGFWLTAEAVQSKDKFHVKTIQDLFAGAGYDPDIIWSRASRGLAKLCFTVSYMSLMVCGSLALATASIILTLRRFAASSVINEFSNRF
jgi:hypothetical protein